MGERRKRTKPVMSVNIRGLFIVVGPHSPT